jgi:hypothetical protein
VIAQELLQDFPKDKLMGEEGVKHLDPDTLNRVAELSGRSESQVGLATLLEVIVVRFSTC